MVRSASKTAVDYFPRLNGLDIGSSVVHSSNCIVKMKPKQPEGQNSNRLLEKLEKKNLTTIISFQGCSSLFLSVSGPFRSETKSSQ